MLNCKLTASARGLKMHAWKLIALCSMAVVATAAVAQTAVDTNPQRNYRAWTGGDFWNWPKGNWTFWTPPKLWGAENIARRYGGGRGRYDQEPIIIAHRGLVSSAEKKLENTVSAVKNASEKGLFAVELDVQADKNGVAWPLHDRSALRPFLIRKNLDEMTTAEVASATLYLVRPESALDAAAGLGAAKYGALPPTGILNDEQLLETYGKGAVKMVASEELLLLKELIKRTVQINDRMSIFLDPKNYKSAVAAMVAAVESGFADRVFIKTYDAAWGKEVNIPEESVGTRLYWDSKNALWGNPDAGQLALVKIAPVFNLVDCLRSADQINSGTGCYQDAENRLRRLLTSWGENFEIQAVEMPGAYLDTWVEWVQKRYKPLAKGMSVSLYDGARCENEAYKKVFATSGRALKHQPIRECRSEPWAFGLQTLVEGYSPMPSTGYRFADFTAGGQFASRTESTPFGAYSYKAFEYQMDGLPKPATSDVGRRTVCAQMYNIRKVKASFVVSDYPIQEMQCNYYFEQLNGDSSTVSKDATMAFFWTWFQKRFADQRAACAATAVSTTDAANGLGARPDCWPGDDRVPMTHLDFFSKYTEGMVAWIGTNL